MMVEMLRVGSPELIRRWVAALLEVPEAERPAVVRAVTERIRQEYAAESTAGDDAPMFHIAEEPVERDGHTEQIIRSYAAPPPPTKAPKPARRAREKRA